MFGYSIKQIGIAIGVGILLIGLGSFIGGDKQPQPTPQPVTTTTPPQASQPTPISNPTQSADAVDNTFLVTRVIDGDTIEIEGGKKIRYIGIDTPETLDPRKPVQCFGVEASNKNKQLLEGKRVRLEKDVSETDKYGRLLRYVYLDDIFINLFLVQEGFAHSYSYPPDIREQTKFVEAERIAREQKKGLWSSCPITAPAITPPPPASTSPTPPPPPSTSCTIKGNISSSGEKIYHIEGCGSYSQTKIDEARGEKWFCSEADAVTAGWRKAKNCP